MKRPDIEKMDIKDFDECRSIIWDDDLSKLIAYIEEMELLCVKLLKEAQWHSAEIEEMEADRSAETFNIQWGAAIFCRGYTKRIEKLEELHEAVKWECEYADDGGVHGERLMAALAKLEEGGEE